MIYMSLTIEKEPRACGPRAGEIEQQGHQLGTAEPVDDSEYRWKARIMKVPVEYYRSSSQRNTTVEARLEIHRRHDGERPIFQNQRCMKAFQSEKEKKQEKKTQTPQPIRVRRNNLHRKQIREEQNSCPNGKEQPDLQWNYSWRKQKLLRSGRTKDREERRDLPPPTSRPKTESFSL